jgi:hypothetical protein
VSDRNGTDPGVEVVAPMEMITDINEFRRKRGRDGITPVRLSDDLVVGCAISNMETLILEKRIPEPLVSVAIEVAGISTGGGKKNEKLDVRRLMDSVRLQDVLCGAIIRQPPWTLTEKLQRDPVTGETIPPDGLCLADLSDEERAAVAQLVYGGLPGLERFRARLRERDNALSNGDGVQETPERDRDDDDGGLSPVREVDVRPRDHDAWSGDEEAGAGEGQHQPTRLDRVPGF